MRIYIYFVRVDSKFL